MQELTPAQRIERGRTNSQRRHMQFLREFAGATYKHELGLCQVEDHLPIQLRHTVEVPAVKPSAHTERNTDKFNFKNLSLADLMDISVCIYQCNHGNLPSEIHLSRGNFYLLALQGHESHYCNAYGCFQLVSDSSLDNSTIICDRK